MQLTPTGVGPPAQLDHSAVWDPTNGQMLVFTGNSGSLLSPWAYRPASNTWVQLTSTSGNAPDAGTAGDAVWDPTGAQVLFVTTGTQLWAYRLPRPRPNVGVTAVPNPTTQTLQTTIVARDAGCMPNNQLQALRFTRLTNAAVDVPGVGTVTALSATPIVLAQQPATLLLSVHRISSNEATTVELVVTDGCGDWPTLMGGGPQAFGGGGAPASIAPAAPSPSPVRTPTPAVVCTPRPPIMVTSAPDGTGRLLVTVAASGAGNVVQALRFGTVTNGLIETGGQSGTGNFAVPLAPGTQHTSLMISRVTAGQATTVNLVVVDGCGEWPTVLGGGSTAF